MLKMTNLFRVLCGLILAGSACSCALMSADIKKGEIDEVDASMADATINLSKYDDVLEMFGDMLWAYYVPQTRLNATPIENRTTSKRVPENVTQMTVTSLAKMGDRILYMDYNKDELAIDLALGTNTMERIAPELTIRGGITEFDLKIEKEKELKAEYETPHHGKDLEFEADFGSEAYASTMAMDFQLKDYQSQSIIPNVNAANKIDMFKNVKSGGFGMTYAANGFRLGARTQKEQGFHVGVRMLVELSTMEVLGEYFMVPYWRCIPNAKPDMRVIERFKRSLRGHPDPIGLLKRLAYAHGLGVDPFTDEITVQDKAEFAAAQRRLGLAAGSEDWDELTVALWQTVPVKQGAKRMRNYEDSLEELKEKRRQEAIERARLEAIEAERRAREEAIRQQQLAEEQRQQELQRQKRTIFKLEKENTF